MFSAHFLWNRQNLPGCFLFAWPLPTYKACLWSAFREYHGDVPWRFVDFGPDNEMIRDLVQVAQQMLCFSQGNLLLMDVKLSELEWRIHLAVNYLPVKNIPQRLRMRRERRRPRCSMQREILGRSVIWPTGKIWEQNAFKLRCTPHTHTHTHQRFAQLPTIQEILAQAISKFATSSTRQKGYHGILLAVSSVMESASMSQFTPINIGLLHNKYEYGSHLERACFIL